MGGALAHGDHDVELGQRLGHRVLAGNVLAEYHDLRVAGDRSPIGAGQRRILIVVENSDADHWIGPRLSVVRSAAAYRVRDFRTRFVKSHTVSQILIQDPLYSPFRSAMLHCNKIHIIT